MGLQLFTAGTAASTGTKARAAVAMILRNMSSSFLCPPLGHGFLTGTIIGEAPCQGTAVRLPSVPATLVP